MPRYCIFPMVPCSPTPRAPVQGNKTKKKRDVSSYPPGWSPLMLGNNITSETRPRIFRMLKPSIGCRPALVVDGIFGLGSREGGEGNKRGEYVVLDGCPVELPVRALKACRISRRARSEEERCLAESVRLFWCMPPSV